MRDTGSQPLAGLSTGDEVLVVHLGGLGDVCLSESIFLSLRRHFGDRLVGLGNRRFLDIFRSYFARTHGVESRHWLYLFSEKLTGPRWGRIVFIGKDRNGSIRARWKAHSTGEPVFIEMYPDGAFDSRPLNDGTAAAGEAVHIEDYQLRQLSAVRIEPARKEIVPKGARRVILYPEEGLSKDKWPVENFVALRQMLGEAGVDVCLMRPPELSLSLKGSLFFQDLADVKEFFGSGGVFVSNDSGMAHLAGASGLTTITIFTGFDPAVWHPRGRNISLRTRVDKVDIESLAGIVVGITKCGD
ncbi:MAG: Glycosyltransferase family 9 (heptosyltransferase) [Syntrophorhabdus sp. PtaB.Bin184]|jgi:ADP-heptose:LPS heptosyltransferase|nr:MAG: Glycosyltransferase family 9 (heptosyltransferase) [Syntrophorhabdus sp. PtaB.Bin184]